MLWKPTIIILSFFCFLIANILVFSLQCCKKKNKKAGKRKGESNNRQRRENKMKSSESMKKESQKDALPNDVNDKISKDSASSKVDNLVKAKEDEEQKKKKDEKKESTALSAETPSAGNEKTPKSKTKTELTGNSDNTKTPAINKPLIIGDKKVSAVLTALSEKEKSKQKEMEEKKFPMEEDIDENPEYDTLQYADKKDVFKTGFTSKGVRIVKEETKKMKLKPGDSAYLE